MRDLYLGIARLRRKGGPQAPDDRRGWKAKRSAQLLVLGLVAFVAVSCGNPADSEVLDFSFKPLSCLAPTCEEVTVKIGDVTLSVLGDGSLRYVNNTDLRFLSSARVVSVDVNVGDVVKEGQALASIDSSSLQLAVTAAMISMRDAEEALEKLLGQRQFSSRTMPKKEKEGADQEWRNTNRGLSQNFCEILRGNRVLRSKIESLVITVN